MTAVTHLGTLNAFKLAVVGQCRIFVTMGRHVIECLDLIGTIGNPVSHLVDISSMGIVDNPVADIVQTRRVTVDRALPITHVFKIIKKITP